MESITKGECPAELDPGSRTQQVSVNLVRSEKAYEAPPKPKYRAFTGTGQTLAGGVCSLADSARKQESFVIGFITDDSNHTSCYQAVARYVSDMPLPFPTLMTNVIEVPVVD